ncbi:MAG: transcriptional regulator, partial [Muribaculaceae bacterium]|nr:transcriptional regulator [Muribaculaceae bacterium]
IFLRVVYAVFMYITLKTDATLGNLSGQITKLEEAGYIETEKTFQGKRPRTVCRMTETGKSAFIEYVDTLREYIAPAISKIEKTSDNPSGNDLCPELGLLP